MAHLTAESGGQLSSSSSDKGDDWQGSALPDNVGFAIGNAAVQPLGDWVQHTAQAFLRAEKDKIQFIIHQNDERNVRAARRNRLKERQIEETVRDPTPGEGYLPWVIRAKLGPTCRSESNAYSKNRFKGRRNRKKSEASRDRIRSRQRRHKLTGSAFVGTPSPLSNLIDFESDTPNTYQPNASFTVIIPSTATSRIRWPRSSQTRPNAHQTSHQTATPVRWPWATGTRPKPSVDTTSFPKEKDLVVIAQPVPRRLPEWLASARNRTSMA